MFNSAPFVQSIVVIIILRLFIVQACLELSERDQAVLFCQNSVSFLPSSEIPTKLAKLRISGVSSNSGPIHNGRLSAYNMTGIENLVYLEIGNFNLEHIEAMTFRVMRQLRTLDLSRNRISLIEPGAFTGLQLTLLSLTENAGLRMVRGMFRGAQIETLAARNCELNDLDYSTLAEAKVRHLSLAHNNIQWLDPQFSNILKPRDAHIPTIASRMEEWGLIDLTNNPLDCTCQLVWLPQLIEHQLYLSKYTDLTRSILAKPTGPSSPTSDELDKTASDSTIKRMYQLNLTCAKPNALAGRPLPHSWQLYCPQPKVIGIDVSFFTPRADHAQLTCTGRGQPPPSLAWTYHVNGHTVQTTLDSSQKVSTEGSPSIIPEIHSVRPYLDVNQLYVRSIAVNVSLREPHVHNFTCTVWNEDSPTKSYGSLYTLNAPDSVTFDGASAGMGVSQLSSTFPRMQELTVRIHGPNRSKQSVLTEATDSIDTEVKLSTATPVISSDQTVIVASNMGTTTLDIVSVNRVEGSTYDYLFTERYSLLQLLGAIFGTFIATLALLYGVTYCLSCACQLTPFTLVKQFDNRTSTVHGNKSHRRWFFGRNNKCASNSLIKTIQHRPGLLASQTMSERTPLNGIVSHHDRTLSKTLNGDSVFSLLTSGTAGPSTVSVRHQKIPQALLMTSVPIPPSDRCSSTPPPNPAYWPMPEYTYTGTGSHEYDVPKPLEPLPGSISLMRPIDQRMSSPALAHSFMNITNNGTLPPSQFGFQHNPLLLHSTGAATLSNPLFPASHWTSNAGNGVPISMMNSILSWNPVDHNGLPNSAQRQLPSISYAPYPTDRNTLYTGDYPTYLQTRPYPHHAQSAQVKISTPLHEMMTTTHSIKPFDMSSGSTTRDPVLIANRSPSVLDLDTSLQNDGHTTETNSSLNDSNS